VRGDRALNGLLGREVPGVKRWVFGRVVEVEVVESSIPALVAFPFLFLDSRKTGASDRSGFVSLEINGSGFWDAVVAMNKRRLVEADLVFGVRGLAGSSITSSSRTGLLRPRGIGFTGVDGGVTGARSGVKGIIRGVKELLMSVSRVPIFDLLAK
jgi:hypothetical protein